MYLVLILIQVKLILIFLDIDRVKNINYLKNDLEALKKKRQRVPDELGAGWRAAEGRAPLAASKRQTPALCGLN